jgi:hypothetical protein
VLTPLLSTTTRSRRRSWRKQPSPTPSSRPRTRLPTSSRWRSSGESRPPPTVVARRPPLSPAMAFQRPSSSESDLQARSFLPVTFRKGVSLIAEDDHRDSSIPTRHLCQTRSRYQPSTSMLTTRTHSAPSRSALDRRFARPASKRRPGRCGLLLRPGQERAWFRRRRKSISTKRKVIAIDQRDVITTTIAAASTTAPIARVTRALTSAGAGAEIRRP